MNNLTKLLITVITTLVLIVGVMIPITSGMEDNIKSTQQNTTERFMVKDSDLNLSITMDEVGVYTINGREHIGTGASAVIGNGLYISLASSGFTIVDQNNNNMKTASTPQTVITVDNGSYSYSSSDGQSTMTGTLDTLLYPDERGSYGAFVNTSIIIDNDMEFYLISSQLGTTPKFVLPSIGGVFDWPNAIFGPLTNVNGVISQYTDDITIDIAQTASEDGLSKTYSNLKFTTNGTSYDMIVYAPIKYHEIDTNANAIKSIVNMLPLILIMGLVVVAGYALMSSMRKSEL